MKPFRFTLALGIAAILPTTFRATDAAQTRELIAVVRSTADLSARARACQQLTIVGTEEAVPALAALLGDEKLSHYAREALETMPYPVAGDALRAALGTTRGNLLVGIIGSVGQRHDAKASAALEKLAGDGDTAVRTAALRALGRIGNADTLPLLQRTLTAPELAVRDTAAEACLLVADQQLAHDQRAAAKALDDAVRAANVSTSLQETALHGALLARGTDDLALLRETLRATHVAHRDIALRATRELRGEKVASALIAEFAPAEPTLKALLIAALADQNDPRAVELIEKATGQMSGVVSEAALQALGRIGREASVRYLVQAADTSNTAFDSLVRIRATGADAAIIAALPESSPSRRSRLIAALGERGSVEALPQLLALARDPDPQTRQAALRALALAARPENQAALVSLSPSADDNEAQELLAHAIAMAATRVLVPAQRAETALAAYRQTTEVKTRIVLLRALGEIVRAMGDGHDVFFVVRLALTERDESLREAAVRCLADWPDATPSLTLLEFAARGDTPAALRDPALIGALRMAGNVAAGRDRAPLDPAAFFRDASRLVRTPEQKLAFIAGLGGLKRFEALQLLQPHLDDPATNAEASLAVVQIAPALLRPPHAAEVKALLEKISVTAKDEDTQRKAARIAKGLPVGPGKQKAKANPASAPAPAQSSPELFNGTDLSGWFGNPGVWRVRDGTIVGGTHEGNPRNEFLAAPKTYRNFILKAEYKLAGTEGFINSGVQFRSVRIAQPPNEMSGYQADIGAGHSGCLYDESRRKNFLARATDEQIKRLEKPGEWNRYEIRCSGTHVEIWLNGEKTVSYDEPDASVAREGLVALQIHGKNNAEVAFRNISIEELP